MKKEQINRSNQVLSQHSSSSTSETYMAAWAHGAQDGDQANRPNQVVSSTFYSKFPPPFLNLIYTTPPSPKPQTS